MSPEAIKTLATAFAEETGLPPEEAQRALESNDPMIIRLAQDVVRLGETRGAWHENMERHRRRIVGAAARA